MNGIAFSPDTLSYAPTYGGMLVLALLMFIGQLTAAGILLVLAGFTWLAAYPIQAIARSFSRPDRPQTGSPASPTAPGC
ncbi:hypothetical protein [Pseudarthrobacter sp. H2]|uniref:hypothetical protein n=1 Tax=Pseudarthrobacter sp. H2 TaxID=3418415 RepID=UPI003CEDDCC2